MSKVVTIEIRVLEGDEGRAESLVLDLLREQADEWAMDDWQVVAIEDDFSGEAKAFGAGRAHH